MNKKGKILVVSAPSGAGKTTIMQNMLKKHPELVFSVSATTRKRRNNEIDGKHYFFITEKEFKKKIENDEFIEWERFYDYYYGTLKSFVKENIEKGAIVVLEVDVKGALNIKKLFPESVLVYIAPPSLEALKERLINRKTDSEEDMKKRIERAKMELSLKDKFDYVVVNDNLENAMKGVEEIIEKIKIN